MLTCGFKIPVAGPNVWDFLGRLLWYSYGVASCCIRFFCTIRISQSSGLFQQLHSRKWQASTFNGHSSCGDSEEKGGRYRLHSNLGHWWHAKNMLNKYVQLWDVGVITIVIAVFSDTHTFHKSSDSGDVTWRWPSTDRPAGWWTLDILLKIWIKPNLVGAIPTPLKNMSSSVGATIPNKWKNTKCSKPPTRYIYSCMCRTYPGLRWDLFHQA